jgi:hypothetical protein
VLKPGRVLEAVVDSKVFVALVPTVEVVVVTALLAPAPASPQMHARKVPTAEQTWTPARPPLQVHAWVIPAGQVEVSAELTSLLHAATTRNRSKSHRLQFTRASWIEPRIRERGAIRLRQPEEAY